jgi:cytochrome bd-type quinol oxidase subunit 2
VTNLDFARAQMALSLAFHIVFAAVGIGLVIPDLTLRGIAAPAGTLRLLLGSLLAGAVVLLPSFAYLFRVFKGARGAAAPAVGEARPGSVRGASGDLGGGR